MQAPSLRVASMGACGPHLEILPHLMAPAPSSSQRSSSYNPSDSPFLRLPTSTTSRGQEFVRFASINPSLGELPYIEFYLLLSSGSIWPTWVHYRALLCAWCIPLNSSQHLIPDFETSSLLLLFNAPITVFIAEMSTRVKRHMISTADTNSRLIRPRHHLLQTSDSELLKLVAEIHLCGISSIERIYSRIGILPHPSKSQHLSATHGVGGSPGMSSSVGRRTETTELTTSTKLIESIE